MKQNLKYHISSAFVLVLLCILAVACADTDTDTQKVQSKVTSYILSATRLYRDYDSNEVAADAKYKGKVVIVSGKIQDIGKDIMGEAYIVIGGAGFLDGVQCMFTKGEQSSVSRLSKGQQVRVKGEVSGKLGNVLLEKCRLQ